MEAARIDLIEPILWFGKTVTVLMLKPPKARLFMRLGEPRFAVMAADKSQYWVEKDEVVSAYLGELVTFDGQTPVDGGDAIFGEMALADILQAREALFGFYGRAADDIGQKFDSLVFDFRCISADACGALTFAETDALYRRAVRHLAKQTLSRRP